MKLSIKQIRPADEPIRKTWDPDKLNELTESIREQGLIVPIKVRPHPKVQACRVHGYETFNTATTVSTDELVDCMDCERALKTFWGRDDHWEYDEGEIEPAKPFEVVYGHRRLEACKRAGLTEIETIVEGVDDTGQLVQAIIENMQREDMTIPDKAMALKSLMEVTDWSILDIERKGILDHRTSQRLLNWAELPKDIQEQTDKGPRADGKHSLTLRHVDEARVGMGHGPYEDVLRKAAKEELSHQQTRRVAEAVAAAPTPDAKKKLLEWEYSPAIHDPDMIRERAKVHGAHDPLYRDTKPSPQQTWEATPEVKLIIDGVVEAAKAWTQLIAEIRRMTEVGKLSPEGRQFTAARLRRLADTLSSFADELEQEKEHA